MPRHKNEAGRNRLVDKIAAIPGALPLKPPLPLVSVHDFMDGNDDRDSLAVNQLDSLEVFRALRAGLIALADAPGSLPSSSRSTRSWTTRGRSPSGSMSW